MDRKIMPFVKNILFHTFKAKTQKSPNNKHVYLVFWSDSAVSLNLEPLLNVTQLTQKATTTVCSIEIYKMVSVMVMKEMLQQELLIEL